VRQHIAHKVTDWHLAACLLVIGVLLRWRAQYMDVRVRRVGQHRSSALWAITGQLQQNAPTVAGHSCLSDRSDSRVTTAPRTGY
jgi:hypothetical protein